MISHLTDAKSDGYSTNNRITFVTGGKHYFNHLQQLINCAQSTLHLQTYIFKEDETGRIVADALIQAAQRGVKVFLMVDGYASQSLSKEFINQLRSKGVYFKFFEPLFRSRKFYLGRRLHHKVCVADLNFALVGGINIADHYNDIPGNPPWLDFALSVEGEIVQELYVLCQKTWNGFQPMKKIPLLRNVPTFSIPEDVQTNVRMRRNDWVRRKDQITLSYLDMFRSAQSEIIILSSYFLPGRLFRKGIRFARKNNVSVTVIVTSISDVKIAKMAERHMYDWLLSNGVRIMEYNLTVLHGKLAICDKEWVTLGSFNVNDISTYASVELNLDVKNPSFASEVRQYLEKEVMSNSTIISDTYVAKNNSFLVRMSQKGAFMIFRVLFYFFTFYFKRMVDIDKKSPH
ncbi:MAG TPA: phospholipase [Cytophagales bacterium]|nr:phospholipase [Cytophagales bacterium]